MHIKYKMIYIYMYLIKKKTTIKMNFQMQMFNNYNNNLKKNFSYIY